MWIVMGLQIGAHSQYTRGFGEVRQYSLRWSEHFVLSHVKIRGHQARVFGPARCGKAGCAEDDFARAKHHQMVEAMKGKRI